MEEMEFNGVHYRPTVTADGTMILVPIQPGAPARPTDFSVGDTKLHLPAGPQFAPRAPSPDQHLIQYTGDKIGPVRAGNYEASYTGGSNPGFPPRSASCPVGYDPALAPESFLGRGCNNPSWVCDRGRLLPPWLSNNEPGVVAAIVNDYTAVGTIGQMRAVFDTLYAIGEFQQTRYVGQLAGTTSTATVNSSVPSLGVRIDWGVSLLAWAPFDLNISTTNFETLFTGQTLNRSFSVRVGGANGGSIYIPFAQRATGITQAQPAIGRIAGGEGGDGTVAATGIPAAIGASFSMTVQLLTAFHPITAAFGEGLNLLD